MKLMLFLKAWLALFHAMNSIFALDVSRGGTLDNEASVKITQESISNQHIYSPRTPTNGCETLESENKCDEYLNCIWKKKGCKFSEASKSPVIFFGNSFTLRNNMVGTFYKLARSTGENPLVVNMAIPSFSLQQHTELVGTIETIQSRNDWKAVVLQEQSIQLSYPKSIYSQVTLPALFEFQRIANTHSKSIVLYLTWGYLSGRNPEYEYSSMQQDLINGYEDVAMTIGSTESTITKVSPVGYAWRLAFEEYGAKLYDSDGRHPSKLGSYLAALVHFSTIYNKSALETSYRPKGVSKSHANRLIAHAEEAFQRSLLVVS